MERLWHDGAAGGRADGPADREATTRGATTGGGVRFRDDPHRDLAERAEWVASNFVMSLDGAIAVDGRSGDLGGDGDWAMFRSLRDHADAVVVGAGTARTENYGPTSSRSADERAARGQASRPTMVLVTRGAELRDLDRLWSAPEAPVVVLTGTDAPDDEVAWLRERAEVVAVGDDGPDLPAGFDRLRDRGLRRLLSEGGPALHADLLRLGLVTDVFTTLAATVVGGAATSVPEVLAARTELGLAAVWRHGDELYLHHRVGSTD